MAVQYQFKTLPGVSAPPPALPVEEKAMLRYFLGRHIELPKVKNPEVSIIIPVFNQYRYTIACLQSLVCACAGKTSYEVILADDGSTDETRDIGSIVENLRIVHNTSEMHGFLPNVNFAAQSARGKYIFLLNNDTLLLNDGDLLDQMTAHFKRRDVGVVGCQLLRADGSLYDCGRVILVSGYLMNAAPPAAMLQSGGFESDIVEGSAMMVRADDWRKFGGFDPVYGRGYFEESDYCLKVKTQNDQRIITALGAKVIHFTNRSFQHCDDKNSLFVHNAKVFFGRWTEYLTSREAGLTETEPAKRAAQLWKKLYARE